MRREYHRRRGVFRASSGGWGHRAVYVGAIVASVALVSGFAAALLVYGPLGVPLRQKVGTTLNTPPKGITFGNASVMFASELNLTNSTGVGWTWNGSNSSGPCNVSANNTVSNNSALYMNISGNTTLVCLNSVNNGALNESWFAGLTNTYTLGGAPNGSYFLDNATGANISSCTNFTMYNEINTTYSGPNGTNYLPCPTYFEQNNGTTWLPELNSSFANSTLWSPNQTGYLPGDVIYTVPVTFVNATNGSYSIGISIQGVTPVAQTFYFNYTLGGTGINATVLFTFDMTTAWLLDLSYGTNSTYDVNTTAIYASIGTVSAIVTECPVFSDGTPACPAAVPQF